jgi:HSP20 family protein
MEAIMANVTPFNPSGVASPLSPILDEVEDLMRGFFIRPMNLGGGAATGERAAPFRMEVSEDDKAYRIVAELPGVRKEDINVAVDGNQVQISAEIKREKDAKEGERVLHSERYYGKVSRTITLGREIDPNNVQARYADGVLELTLPKSADATPKRISIQ